MTQDQTPDYKLIQQRIDHERELREENAKNLKIALDLQAKEYDGWKLSVMTDMAIRKGEEAQSRRSWTIVVVIATLAINAIALVLAFMIHNAS
jgi:hypothetical protein